MNRDVFSGHILIRRNSSCPSFLEFGLTIDKGAKSSGRHVSYFRFLLSLSSLHRTSSSYHHHHHHLGVHLRQCLVGVRVCVWVSYFLVVRNKKTKGEENATVCVPRPSPWLLLAVIICSSLVQLSHIALPALRPSLLYLCALLSSTRPPSPLIW